MRQSNNNGYNGNDGFTQFAGLLDTLFGLFDKDLASFVTGNGDESRLDRIKEFQKEMKDIDRELNEIERTFQAHRLEMMRNISTKDHKKAEEFETRAKKYQSRLYALQDRLDDKYQSLLSGSSDDNMLKIKEIKKALSDKCTSLSAVITDAIDYTKNSMTAATANGYAYTAATTSAGANGQSGTVANSASSSASMSGFHPNGKESENMYASSANAASDTAMQTRDYESDAIQAMINLSEKLNVYQEQFVSLFGEISSSTSTYSSSASNEIQRIKSDLRNLMSNAEGLKSTLKGDYPDLKDLINRGNDLFSFIDSSDGGNINNNSKEIDESNITKSSNDILVAAASTESQSGLSKAVIQLNNIEERVYKAEDEIHELIEITSSNVELPIGTHSKIFKFGGRIQKIDTDLDGVLSGGDDEIVKNRKKLRGRIERLFNQLENIRSKAVNTQQPKKKQSDFPEEFYCPISSELMSDPVIAVDGHTYERKFIEEWFKNHNRSPMTNLPLQTKNLLPNLALKKMINDAKQKQM